MGNEKEATIGVGDVIEDDSPAKIGIGPEGRLGGLIQFIGLTILGTLLFVYAVPPELLVLKLLPAILIMLIAEGHLVLIGDCFPCAPPAGNWTPAVSRFAVGVKMTILWGVFTFLILLFMRYVYPQWPIGPLYLWFGAIGFWCTLLYGKNWNTWPFKGRLHPWGTMAAGFVVVMLVSILVWNLLTNLDGTPFANAPMDHKGPLNVNWLTGYIVWAIAWFFVFCPVFVTQGWPFRKWGHPGAAIGQTILSHILALVCWQGSLAIGISPTFSFGAVASSIVTWSLFYSWHFQFWGITKLTGAARAIAAFIAVVVISAVWIAVCNVILAPAADAVAAAKLPADINILIIYLNLCILAPAFIAHNAFWLRWPLTLPTPPGTPPPDQSV